MALCGQSEDHAVTSCDPQQQPGFKRDLKNNKSQSKPNTPIGGRWWWSPGLSGRRHHHGELICHLSQKVTKMEAGLIKKATRKVKRRTRR